MICAPRSPRALCHVCAPPVLQHFQSINQPGLGFTSYKSVHGGGGGGSGDVHQSKCRSLSSAITSLVPGTNRYSSPTVHYACSTAHCLSFVSFGHVILRPVFIYFIFSSCSAVQKVFFLLTFTCDRFATM